MTYHLNGIIFFDDLKWYFIKCFVYVRLERNENKRDIRCFKDKYLPTHFRRRFISGFDLRGNDCAI